MKLPYSWIKELSGVDWPVTELTRRLTGSGTNCVAAVRRREHFENVVVGRIVKLSRHPNADKLVVAEVDDGTARLTVICGAPNCAEGQKVALALPGADLKGEFKVKEITMRGVRSAGMICAEDELGLSDDHSGIMVLDEDAPVGQPVFEYLQLDDAIINFEITPNRPDCLCAVGIAREAAALAGREFRFSPAEPKESKQSASDFISVRIDDPDGCPRYTARIIENVTVKESPRWLKKRLSDCGVRPINNIVDITNLVMLETGHPLHAFDYHRFGSKEIIVRRAGTGEKFTTLDGNEHTLDESVLLITNGKVGVAAAGVMGGLESEVSDSTRTVLLEAAYFDPSTIRKSARKIGLSSESCYRFERGVDPNGVVMASNRAAALMAELAGGEVLSGVIDAYPKKITPVPIDLRPARVRQIIGADISDAAIENSLRLLGMEVKNGKTLVVTPPTFRPDINKEIDLVEETARVYGLDNIPVSRHNSGPLYTPLRRIDQLKSHLREILTGFGFDETLGSGMAHLFRLGKVDSTVEPIKIANPLSDEFAVMRPRLLYSLLESTGNNVRFRNIDLRLFEIGRIYRKGETLWPREEDLCGFLITGATSSAYWKQKPDQADLFEIKGILAAIGDSLNIGEIRLEPAVVPGYDASLSFALQASNLTLGQAGRIDPRVCRVFDVKQDCFAVELSLENILGAERDIQPYRPLPKFPATLRDIAVIIDESRSTEEIQSTVQSAGAEFIESVRLFDLFVGDPVPKGKKSLAFAISFRSPERTLAESEVEAVVKQIVGALSKKYDARLRE